MRKHYKRTVQLGGETLDGKIHLPLMTKGGEIYQMQRIEVEDRGMVLGGSNLSDTKDRGMVPGGA
jgi:hypothetical protein